MPPPATQHKPLPYGQISIASIASVAFPSGEGGPWDTVDEEVREVAIRLVVENNIYPNLKTIKYNISIIAIFLPTQCHYPYSFIPALLIRQLR